MADEFKRVRPGEDVTFSVGQWNGFVDAARAFHGRQLDGGIAGDLASRRDAGIVRVKNESGVDLLRGSVLGLDSPIFTPTDDVDAFLREVAFRGVVPDSGHASRFAVLLEPAPIDRIVRAYVAGVCPVMVDLLSADHEFAEAEAGETGALVSAESGAAQILWRQGDGDPGYSTGLQWALIMFGTSCGAGGAYY